MGPGDPACPCAWRPVSVPTQPPHFRGILTYFSSTQFQAGCRDSTVLTWGVLWVLQRFQVIGDMLVKGIVGTRTLLGCLLIACSKGECLCLFAVLLWDLRLQLRCTFRSLGSPQLLTSLLLHLRVIGSSPAFLLPALSLIHTTAPSLLPPPPSWFYILVILCSTFALFQF